MGTIKVAIWNNLQPFPVVILNTISDIVVSFFKYFLAWDNTRFIPG